MPFSAQRPISSEVNSVRPLATFLNASIQGLIQILHFLPRSEKEADLQKYLHVNDSNMCSRFFLKKKKLLIVFVYNSK